MSGSYISNSENDKNEHDDMVELSDLTLHLLSGVANIEKMSVADVFNQINNFRNRDVDITSAVMVFLITYLNIHFKNSDKQKNSDQGTKRHA